MSKVVFAACQLGLNVESHAFLWDNTDSAVVDDIESNGRLAEEWGMVDPEAAGVWIFEGSRDESYEWSGTWRRPTVYELHEIAAGRWPKERNDP